ncbi:regulator of RNase E activity RraA [Advenella incenata]|jgi:regulator of RNase E activity RraA|uniref:Putative 4-hydroxy-4-methyl-2-oxoglutarate aldolase n=1 Tax=Advenella incenata TaxID=267800 RepID=A0A4Q7VED3_9BURK|nr:RraA family protein [Advenella incenata]RZT94300.1 regulator of RNase E activity RraA [Advenella incenata]
MTNLPFIRKDIRRPDPNLVRRAARFQAAILADVGGRRGTLGGSIQSRVPGMKVAGPAFTVEVRPGDNLMFHAALAMAQPGDVIVVEGKGDLTAALCGTIMVTQAQAAGLAGFVVDGATRDTEEIAAGKFAVFSAGTNPNGPTKSLGGRINWPVTLAGTTVNPGDLIVGDDDGVVVVPQENIEEILILAEQKVQAEAKRIAQILDGNLGAPWLENALVQAGVLRQGEAL